MIHQMLWRRKSGETTIMGRAEHPSLHVTLRDAEGLLQKVSVQGASVFDAAAAAVDAFRQEEWAVAALNAKAVLTVEVQAPTVQHVVTLEAVERWTRAPSTSPRDFLMKPGRRVILAKPWLQRRDRGLDGNGTLPLPDVVRVRDKGAGPPDGPSRWRVPALPGSAPAP